MTVRPGECRGYGKGLVTVAESLTEIGGCSKRFRELSCLGIVDVLSRSIRQAFADQCEGAGMVLQGLSAEADSPLRAANEAWF